MSSPSTIMSTFPSLMDVARLSLGLTIQKWDTLNTPTAEVDEQVEDPSLSGGCGTIPIPRHTSVLSELIDRTFALFLIRVLALIVIRAEKAGTLRSLDLPKFPDLSTTTICYTLLTQKRYKEQNVVGGEFNDDDDDSWTWPDCLTVKFMQELKAYLSNTFFKYRHVSYHNYIHAYHVFITANKLLDLVLCEYEYPIIQAVENLNNGTSTMNDGYYNVRKREFRRSYGLRKDPLIHLAFLFSALVHDVEHCGVTNRQLVLEGDELAIMYNDQSVLEQRSLAVAFSLIRRKEYDTLRQILFSEAPSSSSAAAASSSTNNSCSSEAYVRFRKIVIDLVLCTDIASPERVQIVKSKYKEAFGEVHKQQRAKSLDNVRSLHIQPKQYLSKSLPPKQRGISFIQQPEESLKKETKLNSSVIYEINHGDKEEPKAGATRSTGSHQSHEFDESMDTAQEDDISFSSSSKSSSSSTYYSLDDIDDLDIDFDHSIEHDPPDDGVIITGRTTLPQMAKKAADTKHPSDGKRVVVLPRPRHSFLNTGEHRSFSLSLGSEPLNGDSNTFKAARRHSAPHVTRKSFHLRLGIRRALDLDGAAIEAFEGSRRELMAMEDPDPPNDLKVIVILEQMLKAADVSANLQNWDVAVKFSELLFVEQQVAHKHQRGDDPTPGWFDNQIAFFESYTLPLARRLCEMGIFEEADALRFVNCTEMNKTRWLFEGKQVCSDMYTRYKRTSLP